MICKVKKTLESFSVTLKDKIVCVALSGGADSMSLLHVLDELKSEFGYTLKACHVNHGIRGESADRDEAFVREQCSRMGIELFVKKANVPKLAVESGIGLEECGRRVRYDFFRYLNCDFIATAHTLSDRCETLLLNIARGTSLKGLCSIPSVRENIIRPLIDCTRDDVEAYCREKNIPFVTDESNFDDTYSRNRVRLNIIPELKKINPSFEQAVKRLVDSASEDEAYFTAVTDSLFETVRNGSGYRTDIIRALKPSERKRLIAKILYAEAGISAETVHLKMVESILGGGRTEIIGDTFIEVKNGLLTVNPDAEECIDWETDFTDFYAKAPTGCFKAEIINKNELPPKQFVHNNVLDFDCVKGKCILRNRRPGDRMRCAGSSCTKTLKKLFNEKHLQNRNSLAVLADEEGILWVQEIGCSDRCKIKQDTKNILLIRKELEND